MANDDDEEELPPKYNKSGFIRGPGFRKTAAISVGTRLGVKVVEAWKKTARERGEPLNKVLADAIMNESKRDRS